MQPYSLNSPETIHVLDANERSAVFNEHIQQHPITITYRYFGNQYISDIQLPTN